MKRFFSIILAVFTCFFTPLAVTASTIDKQNLLRESVKNLNIEELSKNFEGLEEFSKNFEGKEFESNDFYWQYQNIYMSARNYVCREVWERGFWFVNEYIYGNPNVYTPMFYNEFGMPVFNINVVFNQIYSTLSTMEYYNTYLYGYYWWDVLYNEYCRLYNIIYYSIAGSYFWEFDGNYFYDVQNNFLAGYNW